MKIYQNGKVTTFVVELLVGACLILALGLLAAIVFEGLYALGRWAGDAAHAVTNSHSSAWFWRGASTEEVWQSVGGGALLVVLFAFACAMCFVIVVVVRDLGQGVLAWLMRLNKRFDTTTKDRKEAT